MNKTIDNVWIDRAKDDVFSAMQLMEAEVPFNAFYLMQQAVEKMLKGILIEYDIDFEKIHDIRALLDAVENIPGANFDIPDILHDNCDYISQWESDTRYPDELFDVEEDRPIYNELEYNMDDWLESLANYGDFN